MKRRLSTPVAVNSAVNAGPSFQAGHTTYNSVLLLGTDQHVRDCTVRLLADRGYEARVVGTAAEATRAVAHARFVFTLVHGSRDMQSLESLAAKRHGTGPIIVVADNGAISGNGTADPLGPDHVIPGPLTVDTVDAAIKLALARARESDAFVAGDTSSTALQREIGLWRSARMQGVWKIIQQAAGVDVTVLISGETGTGKDLVARAVHQLSSRRNARYVPVNCAAVPRDLLESELFGHEKGAFTGAHQLQRGKFESANRGTLFLDEIGDLHPALQAKLLHVLQDGTIARVGGKAAMKVDVRVLAATNRDLELAVATARFRDDLYYRLNVIHIIVPPLRERREEIPLLAAYFAERYSKLFHRPEFRLSKEALDLLVEYSFPGNVRELENIVKRMIVLDDPLLQQIPLQGVASAISTGTPPPAVEPSLKEVGRTAALAAQREAITRVLRENGWNRVRTAKKLRVSYRSLLYKMKETGLGGDRDGVSAEAPRRARPLLNGDDGSWP